MGGGVVFGLLDMDICKNFFLPLDFIHLWQNKQFAPT